MNEDQIKRAVRDGYAKVARKGGCCCSPKTGCCGGSPAERISKSIGYSEEELGQVPEGANLGLGCGNPLALAALEAGETVLDLGSGAGFDCFLAAKRVGPSGRVIGVDMTPEMVEKARASARSDGYSNVEFRLGEIESLPVDDGSVDVVISNCVINLVPDKQRAFKEAYRVLKPGGRLMVSDVVLNKPLPESVRESAQAYVGCLAGAVSEAEYLGAVEQAGFGGIEVRERQAFPIDVMLNDPTAQAVLETPEVSEADLCAAGEAVVSIKVFAVKQEDRA